MTERETEMIEIGQEVDETFAACRRYLTEFGSVEPELLVRRIDSIRTRIRTASARHAEQPDTLQ
jgi:hypothetical protein